MFEANSDIDAAVEGDAVFARALGHVGSLSRLICEVILPSGYHYPECFASEVALTDEGERYEDWLRSGLPDIRPADVRAALFGHLAHHAPLVDVVKINSAPLIEAFAADVRSERVRYPFLFGRTLYDKFFEQHGNDLSGISHCQTMELLDGTPQGVFQMGRLVTGPFGLVTSAHPRYWPPTVAAPVAHCPEPSCGAVHPIGLITGETDAGEAYRAIEAQLTVDNGLPLGWNVRIRQLLRPPEVFYADFHCGDLLWLVGNAFSDEELHVIAELLVEADQGTTRKVLSELGVNAGGDARTVVAQLDRAELMQFFHLVSDEALASVVDAAVYDNRLDIPVAEVRRAPINPSTPLGAHRDRGEVSRLGLRFAPSNTGYAVSRLKALIRNTRTDDALEWELLDSGDGVEQIERQLDRAIHGQDVQELVERYALQSKSDYEATTRFLRYGRFDSPSKSVPRDLVAKRIQWKLGFDVQTYPTLYANFWALMDAFESVVTSGLIDSDLRIQEVRSVGVNLFAALEDLLDETVAFATWALLSDHYGRPARRRFIFNLLDARIFAVEKLAGLPLRSGDPLELDATGRNSLFGLLASIDVLGRLCNDMLAIGPSADDRRDRSDYPSWVDHASLWVFPFCHTTMLYDIEPSAVAALVGTLERVHRILTGADVVTVRNSVPHGGAGRTFPTQSDLKLSIAALREAIPMLEASGLVPLVYEARTRQIDRYGRSVVQLYDYADRCIELRGPSELAACQVPTHEVPQLIMRDVCIRDAADVLRFTFESQSDFTRMWADYPRRRALGVEDAPGATAPSSSEVRGETTGEVEDHVVALSWRI